MLPTVASGSHDPSGAPFDQDFVTSTGFDTVDAHSGPLGENPFGTVRFAGTTATVSCLNVQGNRASVGVNFEFEQWLLVVEDNHATGTVDRRGFGEPVLPANEVCADPNTLVGVLFPFEEGDYVVHDALSLPVSKDQCKNGGWRSYPRFKNQGDCVSFVATGGKQQP
jgi:hypothetical protein